MQAPDVSAFRLPVSVAIGSVVLTVPGKGLDAKALRALDGLIFSDVAGFADVTATLHAELEKRLGITPEDRVIAGAFDPLALARNEVDRVEAAESSLRAALAPTHGLTVKGRDRQAQQRRDARLALLDLQRDRARRIERAAEAEVVRGIAETVSLAKPGSLAVETVAGKPRARRIGGFVAALDRGVLDGCKVSAQSLYRMGELYRELYEIAIGQRGPDRENMTGGGGSRVPVVAIEAGKKLAVLRGQQERPPPTSIRMAPLQIEVLDLVCGQDFHINVAATRLSRKPATIETVLCQALEIAGANKGAWSA